jgi:hypothetical protein
MRPKCNARISVTVPETPAMSDGPYVHLDVVVVVVVVV